MIPADALRKNESVISWTHHAPVPQAGLACPSAGSPHAAGQMSPARAIPLHEAPAGTVTHPQIHLHAALHFACSVDGRARLVLADLRFALQQTLGHVHPSGQAALTCL